MGQKSFFQKHDQIEEKILRKKKNKNMGFRKEYRIQEALVLKLL